MLDRKSLDLQLTGVAIPHYQTTARLIPISTLAGCLRFQATEFIVIPLLAGGTIAWEKADVVVG